MELKAVIQSIETIYPDVDKCIGDIVSSRLTENREAEKKALFRMEGLMVSSMQELSYLHTFLCHAKDALEEAADTLRDHTVPDQQKLTMLENKLAGLLGRKLYLGYKD